MLVLRKRAPEETEGKLKKRNVIVVANKSFLLVDDWLTQCEKPASPKFWKENKSNKNSHTNTKSHLGFSFAETKENLKYLILIGDLKDYIGSQQRNVMNEN